ncbi:MAG: hypothetical protein R3C61_15635 [Bacteroidia bacterium]
MKHILFYLAIFLAFVPAFSQVEINIQVVPGKTDLRNFLKEKSGAVIQKEDISPALKEKYSFLPAITHVAALSKDQPEFQDIAGIFTVTIQNNNARDAIGNLLASGDLVFAEENRTRTIDQITFTPNDDSLARQWFHTAIRSYEAWDITRGRRQTLPSV